MKLTTLNKNHIIIINSSQTLGKERDESEREQPHATNVIGFSSLELTFKRYCTNTWGATYEVQRLLGVTTCFLMQSPTIWISLTSCRQVLTQKVHVGCGSLDYNLLLATSVHVQAGVVEHLVNCDKSGIIGCQWHSTTTTPCSRLCCQRSGGRYLKGQ